jgi:undecaprenyl-diphosphatase
MKAPTSRLNIFIVLLGFGLVGTFLLLALLTEFHEEITDNWVRVSDLKITNFLRGLESQWLTYLMRALSFIGSWMVLAPVVAVGFFWLLARGSRREALIFAGVVGGASLLNVYLKLVFQRPRPSPLWALAEEASFSFPSGHSVAAFAFYGVIAYLIFRRLKSRTGRSAVICTALVFILGMGASRVYLGVHYPSDVVAGYLVGFIWLATVVLASRRLPSSSDAKRGALSLGLG